MTALTIAEQTRSVFVFLLCSGKGAKYCDLRVSVCLSCTSQKPHVQPSQNFLYMLRVAVARSSDDSATWYIYFRICLWRRAFIWCKLANYLPWLASWHRDEVCSRRLPCLTPITLFDTCFYRAVFDAKVSLRRDDRVNGNPITRTHQEMR